MVLFKPLSFPLMPRPLIALLAVLAWLTLGTQFYISVSNAIADGHGPWHGVVQYLGYFTLITNILCASVVTAHLFPSATDPTARFLRRAGVATTAATAIIIVGVVYHFVLAATWNPTGLDLAVDTMLHYVLPVAFVVFWARTVGRGEVAFKDIPGWIGYPLGYAIYVFARGAMISDYPYPFINVAALGYGLALRNAVGIALVFVVLAALMIVVNRAIGPARAPK